jgi:hypothetical protein
MTPSMYELYGVYMTLAYLRLVCLSLSHLLTTHRITQSLRVSLHRHATVLKKVMQRHEIVQNEDETDAQTLQRTLEAVKAKVAEETIESLQGKIEAEVLHFENLKADQKKKAGMYATTNNILFCQGPLHDVMYVSLGILSHICMSYAP